jgi:osmotically-inducible protein OsmY
MNTDSEIQENIADALIWDVAIDSSRLTVAVRDRIATIEGQVRSFSDKLEARRVAQCAAGVRAVIVKIEVKPMYMTYVRASAQGFINAMTLAAACD